MGGSLAPAPRRRGVDRRIEMKVRTKIKAGPHVTPLSRP